MKTAIRLILLSLTFATLHSQAELVDKSTNSATLKQQLVAAVKADMAKLDDSQARPADSLNRFLQNLENVQHDHFEDSEFRRLGTYLVSESVSEPTRALFESYSKQVKSEVTAARGKFIKEFEAAGRAFLKRAMASEDPEQILEVVKEIDEYRLDVSGKRPRNSEDFTSQIYNLKNCVSSIGLFQTSRAEENWRNAASQLEQMREGLAKCRQFIPVDEAKGFLNAARQSIGLLSPAEQQAIFQETLEALFNDANQDRLEEISAKIRKYQQLCTSSSSASTLSAMATRWQQLASLASSFIQNVQLVQTGGTSRFSPEQWLRSNSESKPVMSRQELTKRLKNYKVRVPGENGESNVEVMYYDIREILDRIQNLEDIQKELPLFHKALRVASYDSDSGNWSSLAPALIYYADLHAKLATGAAFTIGGYENQGFMDARRSFSNVNNDVAVAKITKLIDQTQWRLLQRYFPEVKADIAASPRPAITALMERLMTAKNHQAIIELNQLVSVLTPGQPLLAPSEITAIQHYLAGIRQHELLSEPRIATYHFQKAAAIRSSLIPIDELKTRLQKLKQVFPADYEKGTDDSFRTDSGETFRPSPFLNVPAVK